MKKALGIIGIFVAIVCVGMSCGKEEINSVLEGTETASDTLAIKLGETITSTGGEQLTFKKLVEDSRCPANAMCIWQGMVTVEMQARVGSKTETFTLTTNPQDPKTSAVVLGYEITLVNVFPYPGTSIEEVQESDYWVEVTAVKASN
ncbi:hypothetical protein [uncultured Imperialibacter sp.]|uniref:hypothetical protein n=1 Tax=uncultured Imperialibacter sp. TaxID=1672639 RepID=UPI0030D98D9B|tara:strand:- start:10149 stop:10589 length:441 start_codon:yes stop_codon:yes gene_type:complete